MIIFYSRYIIASGELKSWYQYAVSYNGGRLKRHQTRRYMTLQTELDLLAQRIASFHEPAPLSEADRQNFFENTTIALMAGGESSRFSSVLDGTQANKSAFELPNGDTMIEMCIRMYRDAGFKRFVALVFHNAHSIEERLGDGSGMGVEILYSYDPEVPIGKGGAVLNALENGSIPEDHNLIVANPDDVPSIYQ